MTDCRLIINGVCVVLLRHVQPPLGIALKRVGCGLDVAHAELRVGSICSSLCLVCNNTLSRNASSSFLAKL